MSNLNDKAVPSAMTSSPAYLKHELRRFCFFVFKNFVYQNEVRQKTENRFGFGYTIYNRKDLFPKVQENI